jgi:hypothetical protein
VATSLLDRISQFFRNRPGEKIVARTQRLVRDPRTQRYLRQAQTKVEQIAKDPRTQRTVKKAQDRLQTAANNPRTQAKIRSIVSKLNKR